MQALIAQVGNFFLQHQSFLVLSHVRPDGDAYGSTLGLAEILRAIGKDVIAANEDGVVPRYAFLPGASNLQQLATLTPDPLRKIIAVDTSTLERLGPSFAAWQRPPDLNIDHHLSPGYASLNLIDSEAPATAQVLYNLVEALHLPLPASAATNLYVGLTTDTGSFRFRQTTQRTFTVAAALVAAGADAADLALRCYQSYQMSRILIIREMLNATHFAAGNRVAYYHLTPEMYDRSQALPEDTEGLLEMLQSVQTVEVAFVIEDNVQGKCRVSLRSRGQVDVNQIAQKFGGGGHRLAAGLRSGRSPSEIENLLLTEIAAQLG
jgi:phosphoesterase RecJ-like protein